MNNTPSPRLRDRGIVARELWDWAILDGCWGNDKVHPSDVDGHLEINGFHLFLEGKPLSYVWTGTKGQERALWSLILDGRSTVIVFYGSDSTPREYQRLGFDDVPVPCTPQGARDLVARWASWARQQPPPPAIQPVNPWLEMEASRG